MLMALSEMEYTFWKDLGTLCILWPRHWETQLLILLEQQVRTILLSYSVELSVHFLAVEVPQNSVTPCKSKNSTQLDLEWLLAFLFQLNALGREPEKKKRPVSAHSKKLRKKMLRKKNYYVPTDGKESVMQETRVLSLRREDPLEEEMATALVVLPGNPMDGGAWQATIHGVEKSWTRLSDFTFTLPRLNTYHWYLINWVFIIKDHKTTCLSALCGLTQTKTCEVHHVGLHVLPLVRNVEALSVVASQTYWTTRGNHERE